MVCVCGAVVGDLRGGMGRNQRGFDGLGQMVCGLCLVRRNRRIFHGVCGLWPSAGVSLVVASVAAWVVSSLSERLRLEISLTVSCVALVVSVNWSYIVLIGPSPPLVAWFFTVRLGLHDRVRRLNECITVVRLGLGDWLGVGVSVLLTVSLLSGSVLVTGFGVGVSVLLTCATVAVFATLSSIEVAEVSLLLSLNPGLINPFESKIGDLLRSALALRLVLVGGEMRKRGVQLRRLYERFGGVMPKPSSSVSPFIFRGKKNFLAVSVLDVDLTRHFHYVVLIV